MLMLTRYQVENHLERLCTMHSELHRPGSIVLTPYQNDALVLDSHFSDGESRPGILLAYPRKHDVSLGNGCEGRIGTYDGTTLIQRDHPSLELESS